MNIFANQCRRILCNIFFAKHTFGAPFGTQQWKFLSSLPSLPLFYSRCALFRAWKYSQAPPAALRYYRSPLSAVSSTCKEITWDKCYGSERLVLFTASLTKKSVVWNCALTANVKFYTMRQVSQDRYEFKQKQLLHLKSRRPAPEGTTSMHSSWWEHRGACAGCRNVESHSFMEGGLVCEWQVASCSEDSPSAKHVRIHSRVDTLQDLIKKMLGLRRLRSTNCWRFLSVISGESHPYHIQEW